MSCDICGSRCQGRLCNECELMERLDDELEWRWDDLDDEEDDVDRGDGVATDGGNHESSSSGWESPVPDAQAAAGADEVRVSLDMESTTSNGGMTADISDRVNRLYVESTTDRVIFEVCEEFDTVRASTTMTPDQAEAIGIGLMQAAARASRGRAGVVIKKYNLAAVDHGEGIETDGGRGQDEPLANLSNEELGKRVRETAAFRLAVACAEFDDAVSEIRGNDQLAWRRLIDDTLNAQGSNVKKRDTVEEIVDSFLDQIGEYAELGRSPADATQRASDELVDSEAER
jgi:hypothetical protein